MKTASFITEIALKTTSFEEAILRKRFWAAKQQYNTLLGECLRRLDRMIKDPRYREAKKMYINKETRNAAKEKFKQLKDIHQYKEYSLSSLVTQWSKKDPNTNKRNPLSIGSALSQKLAKRVFEACEKYRTYKPKTKEDWKKEKGKPRFKGRRGLSSIEDKQPTTIKLKNNKIEYLGLSMDLMYDLKDPVHQHCLESKLKYVRIVKRNFNRKLRYFAQLVCEGTPLIKGKNLSREGTLGLDIGPQTIAIVSKERDFARMEVFADELKIQKKKKAKYQRIQSRKERLCNKECFEENFWIKKDKHWKKKLGKNKKGKRLTQKTKSLERIRTKLMDLSRREASTRKSLHGNLVNRILQEGKTIKTEKINYKWFQSLHGKSVGLRAPGMFVEILRRKAENAGGQVEDIDTKKTKLSQVCHCGEETKKLLKERWHICKCGVVCQRDLYSAYLASFVEKNKLMIDQAKESWSGKDLVLYAVMRKLKQSRTRSQSPGSLGLTKMEKPGSETVAYAVS